MKIKISKQRWEHYKRYHIYMMLIGDCDSSYPALNYIVSRFELNIEQRFWLSWLYSTCYCVPTVYYMYNEFPDYENVDVDRLSRWWDNNKQKLFFQTDRAKVKNFNVFIKMFESYRECVGKSQKKTFEGLKGKTLEETYENVYKFANKFYYFGRFTLFLYLESMHVLTKLPMYPTGLDLPNAESCRNGLLYSLGLDDWVNKHGEKSKITDERYKFLYRKLDKLVGELQDENPDIPVNYWNVETSLCAYKKLYWKKRYLGYYIDRLMEEIQIMERNVPEGVDWSVLWDFRKEYFRPEFLGELSGWDGIRKEKMGLYDKDRELMSLLMGMDLEYKNKVFFKGLKNVYV